MDWSAEFLQARVACFSTQQRYPAGSPDTLECGLYRRLVQHVTCRGAACCLGMTPELRSILADCFRYVVSIDSSQHSIEIYAGWLSEQQRCKEEIVLADWTEYLEALPVNSLDCVVGDAFLSNLAGEDEACRLITSIHRALRPSGLLVMRSPVIPSEPPSWRELRDAYRSFRLDEAGFGLGTRLLGLCAQAYSPSSGILDNNIVFDECSRLHQAGELSEDELMLIYRYLFRGLNWIPSENRWLELQSKLPFVVTPHRLEGRHWYQYYQLYELRPI